MNAYHVICSVCEVTFYSDEWEDHAISPAHLQKHDGCFEDTEFCSDDDKSDCERDQEEKYETARDDSLDRKMERWYDYATARDDVLSKSKGMKVTMRRIKRGRKESRKEIKALRDIAKGKKVKTKPMVKPITSGGTAPKQLGPKRSAPGVGVKSVNMKGKK